MKRTKALLSVAAGIMATGIVALSPIPTSATILYDGAAGSDGWGGNSLTQYLTYDFRKNGCADWGGANGYHLLSSRVIWRRADSQFTGRWVKGVMSIYGSGKCYDYNGVATKSLAFANMPTNLESGKSYSRDFGASAWVIASPGASDFLAFAKVDIYRGTAGKQARLCTLAKISSIGDPCN